MCRSRTILKETIADSDTYLSTHTKQKFNPSRYKTDIAAHRQRDSSPDQKLIIFMDRLIALSTHYGAWVWIIA
jgi:hypothetical protein